MKHPERVEDYLGHITEAIERARSYVQSIPDLHAFRQNPLVQDGVVRNIEIIGEATNHIDRTAPDFIAQHPALPWANMRDMRNAVIHAYFNVDSATVWRTVQDDLPKLKQQIDHLLTEQQSDSKAAKKEALAQTREEAEQSIEQGQERDNGHSR
jgi:uncharacterized protein with HEPN domain